MSGVTSYSWDLIRAFLAALDKGSLLGAARVLKTSQPTVGRQIAALEEQLGLVLFERTGRGLLPTQAALSLVDSARAMESAALSLASTAAGSHIETLGTVRLSASQTIACHMLPRIIAALRLYAPHVQIELVSSNTVSNLLRREADIAVRMVRPEQATLIARRIGSMGLGVYASKDYIARRGVPQCGEDLFNHELIGEDQGTSIINGMARFGVHMKRDHFALRSDDLNVQWEALRAGLGIGFIANYVAATDPSVVRLLNALPIPPLPVWLVVHREIHSNRHIRTAFDLIGDALRDALDR